MWCFPSHRSTVSIEWKTKTSTLSLNLILGTFLFAGWILFMSTGGRVCRPCTTALWPSSCHLWGWNHYFSNGAVGLFVWCGLRVLYGACGRMLRARWSVYACECVCARCRACDMAGVHQSKGRQARRLAAPDSALQEGLVWWRAHSESSIPQDKSQGPVDRCEFSGFCAQSPETCRVRNLTFAESQIVFLNPSCCLWQFGAKSEWTNELQRSGCELVWGGGLS